MPAMETEIFALHRMLKDVYNQDMYQITSHICLVIISLVIKNLQ